MFSVLILKKKFLVLLYLIDKKLLIKNYLPGYGLNYKLSLLLIKGKLFIYLFLTNKFYKNLFCKIFSLCCKVMLAYNTMIAKSEKIISSLFVVIILSFCPLFAVIGRQ